MLDRLEPCCSTGSPSTLRGSRINQFSLLKLLTGHFSCLSLSLCVLLSSQPALIYTSPSRWPLLAQTVVKSRPTVGPGQARGRVTGRCKGHASGVSGIHSRGYAQLRVWRRSGPAGVDMKLKQRMVVLCAVLLLLGLAKIFLLDGGEGSAASRRDLKAFRKVRLHSSILSDYINKTNQVVIYNMSYCGIF